MSLFRVTAQVTVRARVSVDVPDLRRVGLALPGRVNVIEFR